MLVELPWYSHRPLWHLIFGGVLERFPNLKVALTEQGVAWLPRGLETLDWFYGRMVHGGAAEALYFGAAAQGMTMKPSEYFARNVWVGASFLRSSESALRPHFGGDRIMWGDDYPHSEGTWPFSREALRVAFAGETPTSCSVASVPTRRSCTASTSRPLPPWRRNSVPLSTRWRSRSTPSDYPPGSTSNAFDTTQVLRAW